METNKEDELLKNANLLNNSASLWKSVCTELLKMAEETQGNEESGDE